jgi:acyl-CoA dehydrogenase
VKVCMQTDFRARIETVRSVAAECAHDVDVNARFPCEALAALQANRVLGVLVPTAFGGEGLSLSDVADGCYVLAQACGSTGLMYAMHSVMVQCLCRHAATSNWHCRLLRDIASGQLLLAGSTSESGNDATRESIAAVEGGPETCHFVKQAATISYAGNADCILTTARRNVAASSADQVVVALTTADYELREITKWDTLGMRGTCSAGYFMKAEFPPDRILPQPFSTVHVQTMLPVAHLLWSSVWSGIVADAVNRARASIRQRGAKSQRDWSLLPLAQAATFLHAMRGEIGCVLGEYERSDLTYIESFLFRARLNALKVSISSTAIQATLSALQAAGLSGYRNDSDHSLGRNLRDICSAPIMISNHKILETIGALALVADEFQSLATVAACKGVNGGTGMFEGDQRET